LRQAQLEMKKKYPDPFYWGAFICQGDPGPLIVESEDLPA
jgi:CHAT domain-containing protein